jgi:LSD1 subclass zinc finger protein
MPIQMICPNLQCRKVLSVPDEIRGKQVKCQHCQTVFRVPEARKPTAIPAPVISAPAK